MASMRRWKYDDENPLFYVQHVLCSFFYSNFPFIERGKNNEVDMCHLYTMYIPDKQIIHI